MNDSPAYVLAIDLGTSGPKAAVVSLSGEIMATGRAHVETLHLPGHGVEQDPDAVWEAVKTAAKSALSGSGVAPKDVLAVIASSQYSSIVPIGDDGNPAMNMVLWLDQRGATHRLKKLPDFPARTDSNLRMLQWLRKHGLPPVSGGMSLTHMRWIKYARPEVYAKTKVFLEPMDYVTYRFTGRATANQCTVFMYLLTDNRKLGVTEYDPALVSYSLIDEDKLPELLPPDAIVGTVLPELAAELGLSPETQVVTGLNDTQSGGMATSAFAGNHAAISVGSTSVMITNVPFKKTDVRHAILSMPSPVPKTYFVMAENGIAGGALEHFLEELIYASDHFGDLDGDNRFELLNRAIAETPPGSDGVLFLPWMTGSLAPAADEGMRGGFLNISMKTKRAHLARAVLEGVALNLRWLREPVEKFAKRRFTHYTYYGGGAESDAWSQIMADVLGAPVHQLENPQYATCVGAGLLAFERLGRIQFGEFADRIPVRRVYEPQPETQGVYRDLYGQFTKAFKNNRPILRALNRMEWRT